MSVKHKEAMRPLLKSFLTSLGLYLENIWDNMLVTIDILKIFNHRYTVRPFFASWTLT